MEASIIDEILTRLTAGMHSGYGYTPRGSISVTAPVTPRRVPSFITDPSEIQPEELNDLVGNLPTPTSIGRRNFVELVAVGPVTEHPAPYTQHLEFTRVYGLPIVLGKGELREGDLAVYLPLGTLIPPTKKLEFIHQNKNYVIQARRFRGVESCGVLWPAEMAFTLRDQTYGTTVSATADCWNVWLDELVGMDMSEILQMRNPV